MTFRSFLVALATILAGAGAFVNLELTRKHVSPKNMPAWFDAVCSPQDSTAFSCDEALKSRWAYFSLTDLTFKLPDDQGKNERLVPVSLLGMFYFTLFFIWYLAIGECSYDRRAWHLVPTFLVLCGVAASGYFVYIMFTELEAKCPWCMAAHGINAILLICTLVLWPRRPRREPTFAVGSVAPAAATHSPGAPPVQTDPPPMNPPIPGTVASPLRAPAAGHPLPPPDAYSTDAQTAAADDDRFLPNPTGRLVLVTFLCACSMLYAETLLYAHQQNLQYRELVNAEMARIKGDTETQLLQFFGHAPQKITIRPDDPARGEGAGWTLILFSDFQCPACRRAAKKIEAYLEAEFKDRLRLVWRHYPLNTKCNPHAGRDLHPDACEAAYAAEAARIQGGRLFFWKFHDLLFDNQARIPQLNYRQVATQLGLNPVQFLADMKSDEVKNRVKEDIELGKSLNIKSTPGMFLGGRPLPSYMFYNPAFMEYIKNMIDQNLSQRANRKHGNHNAAKSAGGKGQADDKDSPDD